MPTAKRLTGGANSEQARRCRRVREAFSPPDGNSRRFAAYVGLAHTRWNNFENGYPLSLDAAIQLCRALPGLTLDYLFFGRPDGLPYDLALRLGFGPRAARKTTTSGR